MDICFLFILSEFVPLDTPISQLIQVVCPRVLLTSMSTCTTPVDRRFGRRRRWMTACVAWALRLSFSLSFSAQNQTNTSSVHCEPSARIINNSTFVLIGGLGAAQRQRDHLAAGRRAATAASAVDAAATAAGAVRRGRHTGWRGRAVPKAIVCRLADGTDDRRGDWPHGRFVHW